MSLPEIYTSVDEIDALKQRVIMAGDLARRIGERTTFGIYFKSHDNPVTDADLESNRVLTEFIRTTYPYDAIVSEEDYTEKTKHSLDEIRREKRRVWFIDPLDGTKEFIAELPYYTVSVGLIVDGRSEIGFVYSPMRNLLIWGGEKYGYHKNEKKIGTSKKKPQTLAECKIVLSQNEVEDGLFKKLLKLVPEENISLVGSIAYKLAFTAAGEYDLTISMRPKADWDMAGAAAFYRRKDLEILDRKFKPLTFNNKSVYSNGLIAGKTSAVDLYKEFAG